MKIVRRPTVYAVGRQELDEAQIQQFLYDHRVSDWTTDAFSSAEKPPEIAGRLCYMSFSKPRPGGNKTYLGHFKEVGRGSVLEHAETEIRMVAAQVLEILQREAPNIFNDYRLVDLPDGTHAADTPHSKV